MQIKAIIFDKALIIILIEYSNYSNIFSAKIIEKFSRYTRINDHIIELEKDKQSLFKLIYSLDLVELEMLKIYIEIKLANSFI